MMMPWHCIMWWCGIGRDSKQINSKQNKTDAIEKPENCIIGKGMILRCNSAIHYFDGRIINYHKIYEITINMK